MSFFRNLFGLGPKEPVNVRPRTNASLVEKKEKVKEALVDIKERNIYPLLLSENTDIFDFDDDIISYYHDREGIFAEIIIGYIVLDEDNLENGEPITYQIRTNEKTEEEFDEIAHTAKINFDDFELPFIDWNENNQNFNFQILTCKVSLFSCEKILSKKHMMEAHMKLNTDELLVSIPRRGVILVCSNAISNEDKKKFIDLHLSVILEGNSDLELLCEDIFFVKNGENIGTMAQPSISEILRKNNIK